MTQLAAAATISQLSPSRPNFLDVRRLLPRDCSHHASFASQNPDTESVKRPARRLPPPLRIRRHARPNLNLSISLRKLNFPAFYLQNIPTANIFFSGCRCSSIGAVCALLTRSCPSTFPFQQLFLVLTALPSDDSARLPSGSLYTDNLKRKRNTADKSGGKVFCLFPPRCGVGSKLPPIATPLPCCHPYPSRSQTSIS